MNSRTTKRFRQMLAKLPGNIRQQAKGAYRKSFALFAEPLDHIAAIVECKAQGKVEHGVDQLYSLRLTQFLKKCYTLRL